MTNEEKFRKVFRIDPRIIIKDMCECIAECDGIFCGECPFTGRWWNEEYEEVHGEENIENHTI